MLPKQRKIKITAQIVCWRVFFFLFETVFSVILQNIKWFKVSQKEKNGGKGQEAIFCTAPVIQSTIF